MNGVVPARVQIAPTIVLALLVLLTVLPLVSLFSTALQPQGTVPSGLTLPRDPHWANFADAWNAAEFLKLLRSTLIIVIGVVPVSVLFATMGGYALAQMRIPGGGIAFGLLIFGLTLPFEAILIPLYLQMKALGLLNTQLAIILPLIGLYMPFSVFWMRSHFVNVPKELTEAAEIDGATARHMFRYIQLPLAVPAWSSLAMLLFLWTTNQFMLAIVLISDPTKRTLAGALGAFQGERTTNVVLVCAVSLLIITPTTLAFVALQRHFVKALLQGIAK
jgi:raffinose/stachyose/melibiose transport system permease protein